MSGGLGTYDQHHPEGLRVGEDGVQDSQGRLGDVAGKGGYKGIMTSRDEENMLAHWSWAHLSMWRRRPITSFLGQQERFGMSFSSTIFSVISMRPDEQPAT